jgi:hypothetical protein
MCASSQPNLVTYPIRVHASQRAGQLIADGQKKGEIALATDGRPTKVSSQTTLIPKGDKPKILTELGITRDQSSDWQKLAGFPKKKKDSDLWRPGSPAIEALALFRLVGKNGDSIDDLRTLIGVSAEEKNELDAWCLREPRLKRKIEGMVNFRELVLAEFNSLVENRSQTAVSGQSVGLPKKSNEILERRGINSLVNGFRRTGVI